MQPTNLPNRGAPAKRTRKSHSRHGLVSFIIAASVAALVAACAGSSPPPSSPDTPVASPPQGPAAMAPNASPPVQCGPTQFVASGTCFDSADAACASLKCSRADCLIAETAPAQVSCKAK
jgi:hypothetical protein